MNPKTLLVYSFLLAAPLVRAEDTSRETDAVRQQQAAAISASIPIFAWWGIPRSDATEERYKEMADAGITTCLPPDGDPESTRLHLELAAKAGIKLIIQDNRIETFPEKVVADFKEYPSLGGYHLQDEPNASRFPALAGIVGKLRAADPTRLTYINLFPSYASNEQLGAASYLDYLQEYIKQTRPAFISYDNYAITGENAKRGLPNPTYFSNLGMVRENALQYNVPFWAFVQTTAYRPHDKPLVGQLYGANAMPTEGQLRFQVFCSLAYGARGIQYFTYWTPTNRPDNIFSGGPIDENGSKSKTYYLIKKINAEITALAPILTKLTSTAIIHSNASTGEKDPSPNTVVEKITGDDVIIGIFQDAEEDSWMLVVNNSYEKPARSEILLTNEGSKPAKASEVDKNTGELKPFEPLDDTVTLLLEPGDGRLLKIQR